MEKVGFHYGLNRPGRMDSNVVAKVVVVVIVVFVVVVVVVVVVVFVVFVVFVGFAGSFKGIVVVIVTT